MMNEENRILEILLEMKQDISALKADVSFLKAEVSALKTEVNCTPCQGHFRFEYPLNFGQLNLSDPH